MLYLFCASTDDAPAGQWRMNGCVLEISATLFAKVAGTGENFPGEMLLKTPNASCSVQVNGWEGSLAFASSPGAQPLQVTNASSAFRSCGLRQLSVAALL
jgi:hypothetical protein